MTEAEKNELRKAFEQMLEEERCFALVNTSHVQEGIGNVATYIARNNEYIRLEKEGKLREEILPLLQHYQDEITPSPETETDRRYLIGKWDKLNELINLFKGL